MPRDISSIHFGHSVLPTSIATGEPSVRPWRMPAWIVTSSCSNCIRGPAAVAESPTAELGLDIVLGDRQAGGKSFDDDDERGAVGLPGGQRIGA